MGVPPTSTSPLSARIAPISRETQVDLPLPLSPTIAVRLLSGKDIFTPLSTSFPPPYEKVTSFISSAEEDTFLSPHSGSGKASNSRILRPAEAPFIATWKAEPSERNGRKNSTATNVRKSTFAGSSPPSTPAHMASAIPAPAPPYATRSIMVVDMSCITSTFMVILRNSSLLSFIFLWRAPSAPNIFNSLSPCTLSRKLSPMEVYLPQYLAKIFFAYLLTATMESGISGTHASSTSAVFHSMGAQITNSNKGAIIE